MKFLVVFAACVVLSSAQFQGFGRNRGSFGGSTFGGSASASRGASFGGASAGASFAAAPRAAAYAAPVAAARASSGDQGATVLRNDVDITPEGNYNYAYETDNGLSGQASGSAGGASGSFSWTSPEGQPISISYVADANGYQPSGDALPTPPPIPPQIARALEWLAVNARPQE